MMHLPRRHILASAGMMACGLAPRAHAVAQEEVKPTYIALGEFTVNLPDNNGGLGYLVIDITVDAVPSDAKGLSDILPRLKEAVIRKLMAMASEGALQPGRTDPLVLKTVLRRSLDVCSPGGIREILITRLLYG